MDKAKLRIEKLAEEPKKREEKEKTIFELWADSKWQSGPTVHKDIYESRIMPEIITRSGRKVQMAQEKDMLYYS